MRKIVGYEKEKNEIAVIREMLHNASEYRKNGVRIPRGVLISGAPGVGKTMLARSIADKGIKLIELRAATCCDDDAVATIFTLFEEAKQNAPSVLLLDEIDKIAGGSPSFFMEENDNVKKVLLQALDDLSPRDEVLVVATCNDVACMGDALTRPGRFDRQIELSLPDEETRKLIIQYYFRRIRAKKEFDIDLLARNTRGFTGAKLECLANDSGILAFNRGDGVITEEDVRSVINKLEFGANEKNPFDNAESLHRVAVHETGHAIAALYLSPDNLYGASVMPQGASNGHIRYIPREDGVLSVSEMENDVAVLLAGHVAERINLGEYLLGSGEDIGRASGMLHHMCSREAAYGYDTVTSGISVNETEIAPEQVKIRVASLIDERLTALDARVERLIYDHPDVFSEICGELEEKYVLSREELFAIKEKAASSAA